MIQVPRITCLSLIALALFGQAAREEYRKHYQAWRQTELTLEADAAKGGADFAQRVQRAGAAARAYTAARIEFLSGMASGAEVQLKRLQGIGASAGAIPAPSPEVQTTVARTSETLGRIAASFGNANDAGIRQVRTALQQERAALDAINQAMADTRRTMEAALTLAGDIAQVQEAAVRAYQGLTTARTQTADHMRKSGAAWDAYYVALANPQSSVSSAPAPAKATAAPKPSATAAKGPAPITPLPLSRYIGGWTFPTAGTFHGPQPETVDLTVREEGGHVTGIFYARFRLLAGATVDPVVQFNFEGDLQATRNQIFSLRTGEGLTGTIELIPGPAINLLEVNFQTEIRPDRIRSGNFLLVKK